MNYRQRTDRTVHARLRHGSEIVRYDISGKWYQESDPKASFDDRRLLTVRQAARKVIKDDWSTVFFGLPGGAVFDKLVKAGLP